MAIIFTRVNFKPFLIDCNESNLFIFTLLPYLNFHFIFLRFCQLFLIMLFSRNLKNRFSVNSFFNYSILFLSRPYFFKSHFYKKSCSSKKHKENPSAKHGLSVATKSYVPLLISVSFSICKTIFQSE